MSFLKRLEIILFEYSQLSEISVLFVNLVNKNAVTIVIFHLKVHRHL